MAQPGLALQLQICFSGLSGIDEDTGRFNTDILLHRHDSNNYFGYGFRLSIEAVFSSAYYIEKNFSGGLPLKSLP